MKAILNRILQNEKDIIGSFNVYNDKEELIFTAYSLELPWRDNQFQKSCIPKGKYKVEKVFSKKFGLCYEIKRVKNRTKILIHIGNNYTDTMGCILLGENFVVDEKATFGQLSNSRKTFLKLIATKLDKFVLVVNEDF